MPDEWGYRYDIVSGSTLWTKFDPLGLFEEDDTLSWSASEHLFDQYLKENIRSTATYDSSSSNNVFSSKIWGGLSVEERASVTAMHRFTREGIIKTKSDLNALADALDTISSLHPSVAVTNGFAGETVGGESLSTAERITEVVSNVPILKATKATSIAILGVFATHIDEAQATNKAVGQYDGVRALSQTLRDAGVPRADRLGVINSFREGSITLRQATGNENVLRFFGGGGLTPENCTIADETLAGRTDRTNETQNLHRNPDRGDPACSRQW